MNNLYSILRVANIRVLFKPSRNSMSNRNPAELTHFSERHAIMPPTQLSLKTPHHGEMDGTSNAQI